MRHLGDRVSALVDGELGHEARDRALAHVAHCAACRQQLDDERAIKERLSAAPTPDPSNAMVAGLLALGEPGDPVPPRTRRMPLAPLVPTLPAPGRRARTGAPRGRAEASNRPPTTVRTRRARRASVGALTFVVLVLGTAFAAGGADQRGRPVVPPAAEFSTEHAATSSGMPLRDTAFDAVTASFGGFTVPAAAGR